MQIRAAATVLEDQWDQVAQQDLVVRAKEAQVEPLARAERLAPAVPGLLASAERLGMVVRVGPLVREVQAKEAQVEPLGSEAVVPVASRGMVARVVPRVRAEIAVSVAQGDSLAWVAPVVLPVRADSAEPAAQRARAPKRPSVNTLLAPTGSLWPTRARAWSGKGEQVLNSTGTRPRPTAPDLP